MGLYAMGKINGVLEARGADASKTSFTPSRWLALFLPDVIGSLGYGQSICTRLAKRGRFFGPRHGELWIELDMGIDIQTQVARRSYYP